MTRLYFIISRTDQWYQIMRECRTWFGTNWRCQPRVKRYLAGSGTKVIAKTRPVWFEVPDARFATWIAVKMALEVRTKTHPAAAK